MTCENCDPKNIYPGKLIKISPDGYRCAICNIPLVIEECYQTPFGTSTLHVPWDRYFHRICEAVASKSPCISRHIGAILVKDHSIVSTGYNGPSRGIPHCGRDRYLKDVALSDTITEWLKAYLTDIRRIRMDTECPRKLLDYESGTHMELCPAQHAEANAISNAARLGVSVLGTTLYMNCIIPCKNCFGAIINSGIVEIVVDDIKVYDIHTQYLIDNSSIKIRKFEL